METPLPSLPYARAMVGLAEGLGAAKLPVGPLMVLDPRMVAGMNRPQDSGHGRAGAARPGCPPRPPRRGGVGRPGAAAGGLAAPFAPFSESSG